MILHEYKCDFCCKEVKEYTQSQGFTIDTTIGDVFVMVSYTKSPDSIICRLCALSILKERVKGIEYGPQETV